MHSLVQPCGGVVHIHEAVQELSKGDEAKEALAVVTEDSAQDVSEHKL